MKILDQYLSGHMNALSWHLQRLPHAERQSANSLMTEAGLASSQYELETCFPQIR